MRVPRPRRLPADRWQWAAAHLPVACVDVLPVTRGADGVVTHVGLIRRESPFGKVWCHVGGRQERLESVRDAAVRTLRETLAPLDDVVPADEPYLVQEYFPDVRPGAGVDPRKHAVAVCFTADVPAGRTPTTRGDEALAFRWFPVDGLPEPGSTWPGTLRMVARALERPPAAHDLLTYEALQAREVSLNELMWQTPVLAMTAIAFLMTIALGDGEPWQRALAAALSTIVAVVSAQLFAKHSAGATADADAMLEIEKRHGLRQIHAAPAPRWAPNRLWKWFASKRSRTWWWVSLLLFGGVSALLVVVPLGQWLAGLS